MIILHTCYEHKPKGENLFIFEKFRSSALLPNAVYKKIRQRRGLHKHAINMQFCENQSTVRKFQWGDSQINAQLYEHKDIMVISQGRRYFLRYGQHATSCANAQRWINKLYSFNPYAANVENTVSS
jgi:hypothetical protein